MHPCLAWLWCLRRGPWFNIKMPSYWYRKSHCGDKTIVFVLSPQWDFLYWQDVIFILNQPPNVKLITYHTTHSCLPWGGILTTCAISVLRNDRNYKYMCIFMFPKMNSAWQKLMTTELNMIFQSFCGEWYFEYRFWIQFIQINSLWPRDAI